jgi:hypothetical protein
MPWLESVAPASTDVGFIDLCGPSGCAMPDLHTRWHVRQYPAGAVWVCGSCGRSWELVSWDASGEAAVPEWVPTGDRG